MKRATKICLSAVAGAILLLLITSGLLIEYKAYPTQSFCRQARDLGNKEHILMTASSLKMTTMQWDDKDMIWIFKSEEPPFFRFACEIEFKDGKIVRTDVVDAD